MWIQCFYPTEWTFMPTFFNKATSFLHNDIMQSAHNAIVFFPNQTSSDAGRMTHMQMRGVALRRRPNHLHKSCRPANWNQFTSLKIDQEYISFCHHPTPFPSLPLRGLPSMYSLTINYSIEKIIMKITFRLFFRAPSSRSIKGHQNYYAPTSFVYIRTFFVYFLF